MTSADMTPSALTGLSEADDILRDIEGLFARQGSATYGEGLSQAAHALQCAALALAEDAGDALVVAALLHDIGHLIGPADDAFGVHRHDRSGALWLSRRFGVEISGPVGLHVAAKRYLCATEPNYAARLSAASLHTLARQGGPMLRDEAAAFLADPHAEAALRLRRWDDAGKLPGLAVPDLAAHRDRIRRLARLRDRMPFDAEQGVPSP